MKIAMTRKVLVAMTEAEHADLVRLAEDQRLTVSSYIRWLIGRAAKSAAAEPTAAKGM